jgi:hypothetical protein
MKFESQYKWLEKQAKIVDERTLVIPRSDLIIALNAVSTAIDKYNDELFLEEKYSLVQQMGLNLRSADKSYFIGWSENVKNNNPFEKIKDIFYECRACYDTAFAPSGLRKNFNERLVELHTINNTEILHPLERGEMINIDRFPELVEYFEIITSIDLTGFPALNGLDRKQCKKCLQNI